MLICRRSFPRPGDFLLLYFVGTREVKRVWLAVASAWQVFEWVYVWTRRPAGRVGIFRRDVGRLFAHL